MNNELTKKGAERAIIRLENLFPNSEFPNIRILNTELEETR